MSLRYPLVLLLILPTLYAWGCIAQDNLLPDETINDEVLFDSLDAFGAVRSAVWFHITSQKYEMHYIKLSIVPDLCALAQASGHRQ